MKPFSYKRILAYFIDVIIVTMLSSLLTFYLPENQVYEKSVDEYMSLIKDFTSGEIEQEEFLTKSNDAIYLINKNSVTLKIVTTVLTITYFVVFSYFMNGQTIGKRLMKIQIVSSNRKKLTMNNYLIRGLIVNSILINVLEIITILGLNQTTYFKVNDILTYLYGLLMIITFGMILFREDRRGLHDILAGTKVINAKDLIKEEDIEKEEVKNKDSKIKDAEIIGERKLKM